MFEKPRESYIHWFIIDKQAAQFQKYICDRDRVIWLLHNDSSCDENEFPKMEPQVVSYQKYEDFQNETFLDSLRDKLNKKSYKNAIHMI